ncbi:MAG: hypothetical protein E6G37_00970 [Actinobacteria bacterium]|nr:MAG: hypothetical protein E6G63_04775 [Actinomycetota bacterium]TMK20114.1 MAG: hypothetical protein E6G65_08030 [Actinomycetota bacterium]TMK95137.1 MAG: hypothetical protein E6G37_00970 [Actinomycetota bacterium]TMM22055.1 MAG: hypothetical protein E6F95_09320 [Actinomycetota bacterium]
MSANVSLARELAVGATTEPIVAWRAWALTGHRDGTELLLRPVAGRSRPWRPREPAEAACKHARLHGAPNVDCSCGLHGTHDVEILRRTRCPAVLGRVAFWGRVIEHELGYRAQFGYPQRLALVCQFCFWLWGPHGTRPAVVGWLQRDELIPFCWPHLEQAQRYGMEPRRLLPADEIDLRLRETYAVDMLAF